MRVEPHSVGSIVHVIKRGARGMHIVEDDQDRSRFVKSLYLLNDEFRDENWHRDTKALQLFERPEHWTGRRPLVSVLAWVLLPNHMHLLLCETQEGGVAKFMQRLGGSMSLCFNLKHKSQGSIFQGSYKGKTVGTDEYLRYLVAYIVVKNVFELFPGGLARAIQQFDQAWEWAASYPFSSFAATALGADSPIINMDLLQQLGIGKKGFKQTAKDMFFAHIQTRPEFSSLLLEKW